MKIVKKFSIKIYHILIFLVFSKIMSCLPIKKGKIVFLNFQGSGFGDSPAEIAKKLQSYKGLDLVWLVKDENEPMPNYIRKVKYRSLKACFELATASAWVDNVRDEHLVLKKKNQIYLQLWHGSISLKKIERDASDKLSFRYKLNAIYDGKIINAITCGNRNQERIFERAFYLKDKNQILKYGVPRNDIFYDLERVNSVRKKVRERLEIRDNEYVILYAPTFRNDVDRESNKIDLERLIDILERKVHKNIKVLIKLHPNIRRCGKYYSYLAEENNKIIDVSDYVDSVEIGICSDAIITDYSSYIYDFAILGKVGMFFTLDYKDYIEERGLYEKLENYPFPLATSNDELINVIKNFDITEYKKNLKEWLKKLGVYEQGCASEKISDWLISQIGKRYEKC
ncbi:CDP-glycerol glycerophosphotransferase family protein [Lachnobacterium bovis]|uniref:CDP-glycerol glycerophosphotransferase family protein n=1 Tax=Lachnobacterium bovis TaxID=140626 RepID=UPI0003B2E713|nr:CDP-glycerol glycerophosphotransferase family protein [Lachnobacterium bovis]